MTIDPKFNKPEECPDYKRIVLAIPTAKNRQEVQLALYWHSKMRCRNTCNIRNQCEELIAEKGLAELKRFVSSPQLVIDIGGFNEDKAFASPSASINSTEDDDNDADDPKIEA